MTVTKTFVENNRTINIYLTNYDFTVIEIHDYLTDAETVSVNFDYYTYDFYYVVELYKKDMLLI